MAVLTGLGEAIAHTPVHPPTEGFTLHSLLMQVAVLTGLGAAPWVVKPLYGFISDTVPIFGYRRRSYLIICGILGEMACLWLDLVEPASQQQPDLSA